MKKIALILLILLSGCSQTIIYCPSLQRGGIIPAVNKYYFPMIFFRYGETKWEQTTDQPGDFAMSGAYLDGKVYLSGYGDGKIYAYPSLIPEMDNTGEATLSMAVYRNKVWATSENNNMQGQLTQAFKKDPYWRPIGIEGYAAYFSVVWGDKLVVTSTRDLQSIDVNVSTDGNGFYRLATLPDWVWVPVVYRKELYILGHSGGPDGPGSPKGVRWNGSSFVTVPALCGVPGVSEWQSGTEHDGYLYLGSGGWTINRGGSAAGVYRYDGNTLMHVMTDPAYHETQAMLSSRGVLYVTMGQAFKDCWGASRVLSFNSGTWRESGYFSDCPLLYALVETPGEYLAAGGSLGRLMVYRKQIY